MKLGKKADADGVRVVTAGNIDKVNDAIEAQAVKLAELRGMVSKELGMYAVAGVSAFGWQLITSMETNPSLDKAIHGWDMEEVKAHEKKLVQYNRDLATASRGEFRFSIFWNPILFGRQRWRGSRRQEVPGPRGAGGGGLQRRPLQEGEEGCQGQWRHVPHHVLHVLRWDFPWFSFVFILFFFRNWAQVIQLQEEAEKREEVAFVIAAFLSAFCLALVLRIFFHVVKSLQTWRMIRVLLLLISCSGRTRSMWRTCCLLSWGA